MLRLTSGSIGRNAPGESYATGGCLPKETGKPELPKFWNNAERKKWIEDVEAWGLWYEVPNIHARYGFEDGNRPYCREIPVYLPVPHKGTKFQPSTEQVVYLFSKVLFFGTAKNSSMKNRAMP